MRRLTIVVGCLVALVVFAVVSVAAAAAAQPAVYECGKAPKEEAKYESKGKQKTKNVYTGMYTEKKCTTKAPAGKYRAEAKPEGKYELQEWNLTAKKGKAKPFKGSGAGANLEIKGNGGVACTSSADTGEFTSATTAGDIVATFSDCEYNGRKCSTAGQKAGTIVTHPLKAGVGYLEGKGTGTPRVGADISAESGEVLAEFKCANGGGSEWDTFEVVGSVIGEVTPVNTFAKEATFTFEEVGIGEQRWKKFEEGPEDVLVPHFCLTSCEFPVGEQGEAESSEETTVVNKGEELMLKA